ncbi:MAG: L,D-transpeptidase family protein [Syntrophobacteraceae bacterium]
MQRPDAALDSSGSKGKGQAEKAATYRGVAPEKEPVRVDYLTLLSNVVSPQIYIYKEKRRLYVVQSNVVVRDYPITLGLGPVGDKQTSGDLGAPDGNFSISGKTPGGPSTQESLVIDSPKSGEEVSIQAENGPDPLTNGAIELYSSDMKELFQVASIGTPVHIRP